VEKNLGAALSGKRRKNTIDQTIPLVTESRERVTGRGRFQRRKSDSLKKPGACQQRVGQGISRKRGQTLNLSLP